MLVRHFWARPLSINLRQIGKNLRQRLIDRFHRYRGILHKVQQHCWYLQEKNFSCNKLSLIKVTQENQLRHYMRSLTPRRPIGKVSPTCPICRARQFRCRRCLSVSKISPTFSQVLKTISWLLYSKFMLEIARNWFHLDFFYQLFTIKSA